MRHANFTKADQGETKTDIQYAVPFHRVLQINWDAGSDVLPFDMPFNFFNVGDFTRGAIFRAKGREFRVSNSIHPKDDRFDSIIAKAQAQRFVRFSLDRLFAPFLSNRMATVFRIPGTNRRAVVSGFGVVFTDVVHPAVTNMRFFDKRGCLIAKVTVPTQPKGLSFAGIIVKNRKGRTISVISKVRITLGTVSLRGFSKKRRGDLVVMDDFLYGEPQKA